jgi:translocation and assembly module TamB
MAARWQRAAVWVAAGVVVLLVIALGAVLVVTQTGWGRERVRTFALDRLDRVTDGEIAIGRLEGNLLRRAVLVDVSIVDEQGRPLLRADTIATRFSLRGLLRQRIVLTDLTLSRPYVVLDRPPGQAWNYVRIFRIDTDRPTALEPGPPGWGDWIELRDVVIHDGHVMVRTEWQPPSDLNGAERERALRRALAGETRENVERVPGGYQNVMDFRELNARMPRIIPTHPDSAGIPIEIAGFSGIVQPFQPPVAEVRDLAGKLRIENDSLHFSSIYATLPESRVVAEGVYALHSGELVLRLRGSPLAFRDMRWLYPPLPEQGGGAMQLLVERRTLATRIVADDMNVRIGEAEIEGRLDVTTGDTLRLGETDLVFARVDTQLLEDFFEGLDIPRRGHLTGRLAARGPPSALRVDGDVTFADAAGPESRILAVGELGIGPRARFRDLRLRFQPLHTDLARVVVPGLPVTGMITGYANLTGAPDGALQLDSDLTVRDARTGLSRVRAAGGVDQTDELRLRNLLVRADPVRTDLLREHLPQLPAGGTLVGAVRVDGYPARALRLDGNLALNDPASGLSRFGATGTVAFNGEPTFDDMQLRLHEVQVDLLRAHAPDLPPGGTLAGALRVNGRPSLLRVAGALTHDAGDLGTSRVGLDGAIGLTGGVRFRDLDLELQPLHMALVRAFAPDLPLGGTLHGSATLNGAPARRIAVRGDIVHMDAGSRSHVIGSADVATGTAGSATVDLALQPLALAGTLGAFVPQAGLQGSVTGRLRATGDLSSLGMTADLDVAGGGSIRANGVLDLVSAEPGYELDAQLLEFDMAALTWRAPAETRLTGSIALGGRGTDAATMRATIAADLVDSEIDDIGADRVRVRAAIADGLATVDSSIIRLGDAEAMLDGSFGLAAGRRGELGYSIAVDSLHAFAAWLPAADTAVDGRAVEPVPIARAGTVGDAAADTAAVRRPAAGEVVVADALLGADSALIAAAEPMPAMPPDSLAGALHAAGTIRGNIHDFDLDGRAVVRDLVYAGTQVGYGEAEYALAGLSTAEPDVTIDGSFRSVVAAGLAFDHVALEGRYRGSRYGEGRAVVSAVQTDDTEYSADVAFTLSLERNELRVADALLRFDTVTWRTAQPAVVGWGADAIQVDRLELVSNAGGRIFADGSMPAAGSGDLELVVENFDVAQLTTLLQQETDATGSLSLDARIRGTRLDPTIEGSLLLTNATLDGSDAPDARATFEYAGTQLVAEAQLIEDERIIAEADARLPIDLALTADGRPRLLQAALEVDVRADSLPVEALPIVTEHVERVTGRISGSFSVRGSFDTPALDGSMDVALGSIRVIPLEVEFRNVGGALTLDGSTVRVDSIVATSGGPIRIAGDIDVSSLARPAFDLTLDATNALLISTNDLRLRLDADVTVEGPLDAIVVGGTAHARSGMVRIPELSEVGAGNIVNLDDPATFARVDTILRTERDALLARSSLLDNVSMDIALTIDRDVWLRSPEANVEIYTPPEVGPLRVTMNGADDVLNLIGTINTDRGEYEFMSRRFNLTRGAVTFTADEAMDPLIQIAAEHEVRIPGREAFEIRVVLSGTVSDLSIALESTSQPPLSQTDLLSYLAFGRDASSLFVQQGSALSGQGGDAGELVGNVAGLATQQLAAVAMQAGVRELEQGALRDLGLDVFRITPADLPAEVFTGNYLDLVRGTQVEAGRYVSPRLFVATQTRLTMTRPGIRAEYWSPLGIQWHAVLQSRYLPLQPTLAEQEPRQRMVFGAFLFREWRF